MAGLSGAGINGIESVGATTDVPVRNETGGLIAKGKLVSIIGYSSVHERILIDIADKDDSSVRPALGAVLEDINDNENGIARETGIITEIDTSSWSINDILALGNNGLFSRPPPDVDPFTGEIQFLGTVVESSVAGKIFVTCNQSLLAGSSRCSVRQTSGQTIPTGSLVLIQFHSEIIDTDNMFNPAGDNTRIVIPYAGLWQINSRISFETNATGERAIWVFVNGIFAGLDNNKASSLSSSTAMATPIPRRLVANDYLQIGVSHNAGVDVSTEFTFFSGANTIFDVTRIG